MTYEPKGYPRLASLMSNEKEAAIFRRFDDLNILSLLALQAEIIDLDKDLRRECRIDDMMSNGQQQSDSLVNSESFKQSRESDSAQYRKIKDLRHKLKEYITAVDELAIQISKLNTLNDPMPSQFETLKDWLRDRNGSPFLTGYEAETWAENKKERYMCLKPPTAENDPFTRYTSNVLVGLYHRLLGQSLGTGENLDKATGHTSYSSPTISKTSNIITTILASLLPVLAIFVLNQLSSTNSRIGITALFTATFSFMITLFSSAKRVEIITATATFAAVEVVFIGSAIHQTEG